MIHQSTDLIFIPLLNSHIHSLTNIPDPARNPQATAHTTHPYIGQVVKVDKYPYIDKNLKYRCHHDRVSILQDSPEPLDNRKDELHKRDLNINRE